MKHDGVKEQLAALFRSHPYRWFSMFELAKVAGSGGWRTRTNELQRGEWREKVPLHIERREYRTVDADGKRTTHSDRRYIPPQPAAPRYELLDLIEQQERA